MDASRSRHDSLNIWHGTLDTTAHVGRVGIVSRGVAECNDQGFAAAKNPCRPTWVTCFIVVLEGYKSKRVVGRVCKESGSRENLGHGACASDAVVGNYVDV